MIEGWNSVFIHSSMFIHCPAYVFIFVSCVFWWFSCLQLYKQYIVYWQLMLESANALGGVSGSGVIDIEYRFNTDICISRFKRPLEYAL